VVKSCRDPGDCRVTVVAGVAAVNMCRCLASGNDAVVAGVAGSENLRVIDRIRREPQRRAVTTFATVCRTDVRR